MVHTEGHMNGVNGIAFQENKNDVFATIDDGGYIFIWDNNDLSLLTKCSSGTQVRTRGCCVSLSDDGCVVGGFEDGFIRAYAITKSKFSPLKWEIVNAHKGRISSIYCDKLYILSGGQDGIVRVWARNTRQMITQISIHTKDVVSVFPDCNKPQIIHSCSLDKTVHSFDLKQNKKIILHQAKNGSILDMTQRKDHEQELITCGINTPILFWDCDVIEPVQSINYPDKLTSIETSPSGKILAAGTEFGEVIILEMATLKLMGKFIGHSSSITKIKWTPDEKQLISTSVDSSICIWNFFPN